jgi:hypothetical protein
MPASIEYDDLSLGAASSRTDSQNMILYDWVERVNEVLGLDLQICEYLDGRQVQFSDQVHDQCHKFIAKI